MMERSLHSSLLGTKSPFSPRSRQSISTKRQFASPALSKSGRFSVSGRSVQSTQIILKTPYNYVERFSQLLPVLVTEALTFVDRNTVVTARVSECGYAWIVCGRRLLVWQYRQTLPLPGTPQRRMTPLNQCYELQLPQSDLAHRSELVSVFLSGTSHIPSCIAVSPEGLVRYWPAVAHEGTSVEQSIDLHGQECDSLTDVEGLGCILATTTCTVVLVQPQVFGGRHSLNCHTLRAPAGWLGGISKRMSSLIFGPISTEHSAETKLVRVLAVKAPEDSWFVYVLAGHSLHKWRLSLHESEQLVYMAELNRLVRDGFHMTVWENCNADQSETDTWLLDIQSDKDSVIVLAAAVNMQVSPQLHYAMISFQTAGSQPPSTIKDFLLLKISNLYREDDSSDCLSYRFLLCGTNAYLYNHRNIIVIKPQEDPDTIEFNSPQDFLLGGSVCVNTPVFFSRSHGLVSVASNDFMNDLNASTSVINSPAEVSFNDSVAANLTLYNLDPDDVYNAYKDISGQFKAAFIFYVKHQQSECQDIIQELFTSSRNDVYFPGIDSTLDKVVVKTCEDLLDDMPSGDPRWEQTTPAGLGSSYSLQVLQQLQDKQKAQTLYYTFLRSTNLWDRLAALTIRDTSTATVHVLGELAEKLVAAIVLKGMPTKGHLEKAIEEAVGENQVLRQNGLSVQDLFYREVTKVYRALQELVTRCDTLAHSDLSPLEVAKNISEINDIILNVLKEVIEYRQQNSENYTPSSSATNIAPDYLPWTSSAGPEGLYDSLMLQQSLTYNYGAKISTKSNLRSTLYDQLVNLIDIILDGRKCHLESIRGTERESALLKQYEIDRHKIISPLVADNELERAAVLAEKYLDFETLVVICEKTDNQQRLEEYMERFDAEKFSEYVYTWYLQQNKQGKLMERYRKVGKSKSTRKLTIFLSDHPSLSWMQNIYDKKFTVAADTLRILANQEIESVVRQKTMLSVAKLAKLAAPGTSPRDPYIQNINSRLELVTFQEEIPDYVLDQFGYNTLKPCVIPPKDLIGLYISSEYKDATEVEFKKALDLLAYIDNEEQREELFLKIWCTAILRDSWDFNNVDSPLSVLQHTLFFRLTELAVLLGANPQNVLPPLETLINDSSLNGLKDNKNFLYLIKTGYEHVYKSHS